MSEAKLGAYIKRLNSQDDDVRAREAADRRREHREARDPMPLLVAHTPMSQKVNRGAEYRVQVRYQSDATEDQYVEFARCGYDLMVSPREVFDLTWFGEALSLFKVVRITGLPMIYTGWKALESLRAVEALSIDGIIKEQAIVEESEIQALAGRVKNLRTDQSILWNQRHSVAGGVSDEDVSAIEDEPFINPETGELMTFDGEIFGPGLNEEGGPIDDDKLE
jgi:hypothetical protein